MLFYFFQYFQFVRVMQHMASDLGFFGIVWGILVLAFSAAMLGAGLRTGASYDAAIRLPASQTFKDGNVTVTALSEACTTDSEIDTKQPWQHWAMWWFIRTYLQSLGQVNMTT